MKARARTPTLVTRVEERRARDRRDRTGRFDRRRRDVPVEVDRRWPFDRRRGQRRDSLTARLLRYVG